MVHRTNAPHEVLEANPVTFICAYYNAEQESDGQFESSYMRTTILLIVALTQSAGCNNQSKIDEHYPAASAEPPATVEKKVTTKSTTPPIKDNDEPNPPHRKGRGPGRRMGMGPGMMGGNREDMTTIHALFAARDKVKRRIDNLPNGARTLTESDDKKVAKLIQKHVPAMEERVANDEPLPPMRFHPLFIALIENVEKVAFEYDATEGGVEVTYTSDDPYVVKLIQEHAKLVSRFIQNGMTEIHKPYTLPKNETQPGPKK